MTDQPAVALDRTDKILLGSCVAVWLVALGAGVAATVSLVNLGTGHTDSGGSDTPWVLYVVIAVSAVVIAGAVPLLLRARRGSGDTASGDSGSGDRDDAPGTTTAQAAAPARREAATEKFRAPSVSSRADAGVPRALLRPPGTIASPVIDQLWLRCAAGLACAMGASTFLVGTSTYLMAVDAEPVAWALYGVAGLITVGMAAIPWYVLREMRADIES